MEYVYTEFNDCYADEFDITGFKIMTAELWEMFKEACESVHEDDSDVEWHFGTNQSVELNINKLPNQMIVKPMSNEQMRTVSGFVGMEAGVYPDWFDLLDGFCTPEVSAFLDVFED